MTDWHSLARELQSVQDAYPKSSLINRCAAVLSNETFNLLMTHWDSQLDTLPDAISEAAEMCARLDAIANCPTLEGCHLAIPEAYQETDLGEYTLEDGAECVRCPAEWHDGVGWV
jgi:hypothetical protein